jgi:sialic acid synthase
MFENLDSNKKSYVIAEVGNNHQGDLDIAREYVEKFADLGASAIKFQTRNNKYLFSESGYLAPYNSENSFATTYGEHRELLELKPEWLPILKADCDRVGVDFMSTPFDEPSLDLLCDIGVSLLKIASFDLGNLPYLNRIASKGLPVVLSCGGGQLEQIRASYEVLKKGAPEIAILHCVSEYPCEYNCLGLDNLDVLAREFPDCTIGLSDHFTGILSGPVAYMKGARVFEKHVTMNRAWKGTDHGFALEPEGFRKFVRDISRVPKMLPPKPKESLGSEMVFKKLGKSIVAYKDISKGERLTLENLTGKIFDNQGIPVRLSKDVVGKVVTRDVSAGELIEMQLLSD